MGSEVLDRFRIYWAGMRPHYVRWLRSWTFPRLQTDGGNWRRDNPLHAAANLVIEGPRVEEKVALWLTVAGFFICLNLGFYVGKLF